MSSFANRYLERYSVNNNILKLIRVLGQYHGKETLFRAQSPQVLETLRQSAVIQSTESSNRIEGIVAKDQKRLKSIMAHRTQPMDRSEQEIAGYRDVLNTIHFAHAEIPVSANVVLQFHRDLFKYTDLPAGIWKPTDNTIVQNDADGRSFVRFKPVAAWQTAQSMDHLHESYRRSIEPPIAIEPLLAIPVFVLDFLCIHPFLDGNGRISRLMTLLLLYKEGYNVGRFISLERVIEDTKESYYAALYRSSQGWHEGQHDITPWLEYFLGVMLNSAYREFEKRVGVVGSAKGTKVAMVLSAIEKMSPSFTIGDIAERCPTVGIDHIRKTLRLERDAGRLRSDGLGPKARWIKI